jgi:DNA-binding IclR family transcriptional regulator
MMRKRRQQHGIQSIEVGARLLQALAKARQPQMLRDLAATADMPAAKAHRYLVSLGRMGLIEQQPETGLYDLGAFALDLGLSALARLDPVAIASASLVDLSRETGQTVALAVWANQGPTIVRWIGADTPVAASLRVGSVMPLTRSATGGAFLAFLPRETTLPWLRQELADNARRGLAPSIREQVEIVIAQTRRQGFARTSDFIPGIGGMAAPIFDHSATMVLALVALGYSKPFDTGFKIISTAVMRTAAALSRRLGAGDTAAILCKGASRGRGPRLERSSAVAPV